MNAWLPQASYPCGNFSVTSTSTSTNVSSDTPLSSLPSHHHYRRLHKRTQNFGSQPKPPRAADGKRADLMNFLSVLVTHALFTLSLAAACLIAPTYASLFYGVMFMLHTLVHKVHIFRSRRTRKMWTRSGPLPHICIALILASIAHMTMLVLDQLLTENWDTTTVGLGFGLTGVTSDFYRCFFASLAVCLCSGLHLIGSLTHDETTNSSGGVVKVPQIISTRLFFASPNDSTESAAVHGVVSSSAEPEGRSASTVHSIVSAPRALPFLIPVLSGICSVIWPRIITLPFFLTFIILTFLWLIPSESKQSGSGNRESIESVNRIVSFFGSKSEGPILLLRPVVMKRISGCLWVLVAAVLSLHFVAQLRFLKTFMTDDSHQNMLDTFGVMRASHDTIFESYDGRLYVSSIVVLFMLYACCWGVFYGSSSKLAKQLLEAAWDAENGSPTEIPTEAAVDGIRIETEDGDDDEEDGLETDALIPAARPTRRRKSFADPDLMSSEGGIPLEMSEHEGRDESFPEGREGLEASHATRPLERDEREGEGEADDDDSYGVVDGAFHSDSGSMVSGVSDDGEARRMRMQAKWTKIALKQLKKYSPPMLGLCLALTTILDPCFLSIIWLLLLLAFMYSLLVMKNYSLVKKCLPFALVWSTIHLCATFKECVPHSGEFDDNGVLKTTGTPLALSSHFLLLLMVAVTLKLSTSSDDDDEDEASSIANPHTTSKNGKRMFGKMLKDALFERAQYISLLILVSVGSLHVDLLQAALILFFLVFSASPKYAKRFWPVLVVYEVLITIFLYVFNVYCMNYSTPDHFGGLDRKVLVQRPFETMWEISFFMLLVFFSLWQLRLYRAQDETALLDSDESDDAESTYLISGVAHSEKKKSIALHPLELAKLRLDVSLLFLWVALVFVFLFAPPTIMTAVYLVFFLVLSFFVSMVFCQKRAKSSDTLVDHTEHLPKFADPPAKKLVMVSTIIFLYSGGALLTSYLFQFDGLRDAISHPINALLECSGDSEASDMTVCVLQVGYKEFSNIEHRVLGLLPHWIIFALAIYQLKCVTDFIGTHKTVAVDNESITSVNLRREDIVELHSFGITKESIFSSFATCKRLLIVFAPYILIFCLFTASCIKKDLLSSGYFFILLLRVFVERHSTLFICVYAGVVMLFKFWAQYKFFFFAHDSFFSQEVLVYIGTAKQGFSWTCPKMSPELCGETSGCHLEGVDNTTCVFMHGSDVGPEAADGSLANDVWFDVLVFAVAILFLKTRVWCHDDLRERQIAQLQERFAEQDKEDEAQTHTTLNVAVASSSNALRATLPQEPNTADAKFYAKASPNYLLMTPQQYSETLTIFTYFKAAPAQSRSVHPSAATVPQGKLSFNERAKNTSFAAEPHFELSAGALRLIVRLQAKWRGIILRRKLLTAVTVECEHGDTLTLENDKVDTVITASYCGLTESVNVTTHVNHAILSSKSENGKTTTIRVSDAELNVKQYLGPNKVLRVFYIPKVITKKQRDNDWQKKMDAFKEKMRPLVEAWQAGFSAVLDFVKETLDFGLFRYSLEATMLALLITSTLWYDLFQAVVYFIILVVLRERQEQTVQHLGVRVAIFIFLTANYCLRQYLFVGMPSTHLWGPFKTDNGVTTERYYVYFGANPSKVDLFGNFICFYVFVLHCKFSKRFLEWKHTEDEFSMKNTEIFAGAANLSAYLSIRDEEGMSNRAKLIELKERKQKKRCMGDLDSLLPTPVLVNDLVENPQNARERFLALQMMYLPYLCLFFVFIDGTAAAFITVIRMGKLAFAMYLFRYWDVLEWRGNVLWKKINNYFLFAVFIHLVWNVPILLHTDYSPAVRKLLAFVGFTEYTDMGDSPAIQTNVFEVFIVILLYLHRCNFDRFEYVFVMKESYRSDIKSAKIGAQIVKRMEQRRNEGLEKTKELILERRDILRITKEELSRNFTNASVPQGGGFGNNRKTQALVGFTGAGGQDVVFPPPAFFDAASGTITDEEKEARALLRHMTLVGYQHAVKESMEGRAVSQGAPPAYGAGNGFRKLIRKIGLEPDTVKNNDNKLFNRLRRAFMLSQRVGRVSVPEEYIGNEEKSEDYIKGLLEGPYGLSAMTRTDENKAFYDGKEAVQDSTTPQECAKWVMTVVGAVAANAASQSSTNTVIVRLVRWLNKNCYLGASDMRPADVRRSQYSQLFSVLLLFVKERTDIICYLILAVNFSVSVSLFDMLPAMSPFVFALLANPGPPPLYWEGLLMYIQCLLCVKCIAQALAVSGIHTVEDPFAAFCGKIERSSFFWNVFGDFCSIVAILARQSVLKRWGIYHTQTDIEVMRERERQHATRQLEASVRSRGIVARPSSLPPGGIPVGSHTSPASLPTLRERQQSQISDGEHSRRSLVEDAPELPRTHTHDSVEHPSHPSAAQPPGLRIDEIEQRLHDVGMYDTPRSETTLVSTLRRRQRSSRRISGPGTHVSDTASLQSTKKRSKPSAFDRIKEFYLRALSPLSKSGTTHDYYIISLFLDFFTVLIFIALYSKLQGSTTVDLGEAISQNLLPGALVLGLIVLVMSMVLDRIVYLYASLKSKFFLQVVLTLGYFVGMFAWYHTASSGNVRKQSVSDGMHTAGAVIFLSRIMWLFLSAKQISSGFPEIRSHDCFTPSSDPLVHTGYGIVKAIPFLWEMRVLLDWTCSTTTLKLNCWLKLEDVRNVTYERKMEVIDTKRLDVKPGDQFPIKQVCVLSSPPERNKTKQKLQKVLSGWLLMVVMLFLIFFPLLYYSTFSPALTTNSVIQLKAGLAFDGVPPFYQVWSLCMPLAYDR